MQRNVFESRHVMYQTKLFAPGKTGSNLSGSNGLCKWPYEHNKDK